MQRDGGDGGVYRKDKKKLHDQKKRKTIKNVYKICIATDKVKNVSVFSSLLGYFMLIRFFFILKAKKSGYS